MGMCRRGLRLIVSYRSYLLRHLSNSTEEATVVGHRIATHPILQDHRHQKQFLPLILIVQVTAHDHGFQVGRGIGG